MTAENAEIEHVWLLDAGGRNLEMAQEMQRRLDGQPWWARMERRSLRRQRDYYRAVSHVYFKAAADFGREARSDD